MTSMEKQLQSELNAIKKRFTEQDVYTVAEVATNDNLIKVLEYSLNPFSSEFLGCFGSYWSLKITVKSTKTDTTDNLSFFLKYVPLNVEQSANDYMKEKLIFEEESDFFKKIYPFLMENFLAVKWLPTCYLADDDVLVLEDLRMQGYKLRGRFFDETDTLKSALKTVAHFHSCSILAEARINTPLNKHYPNSFREKIHSQSGLPRTRHLSSLEIVTAIAKNLGKDTEKLEKTFELVYDLVKPSTKHRNVICHNDLWANNIMFDGDSRCILVDFQTIVYAPLVLDLLKFFYLNTTREYRDKNEKKLIEFYHSVLQETVRNNETTYKIGIPTMDEVMTAYEDLRLFGVITACLYFPDILIDRDLLKRALKIESFVIEDRVEVTLAAMEIDSWFKSKMEETVVELLELSEYVCKT